MSQNQPSKPAENGAVSVGASWLQVLTFPLPLVPALYQKENDEESAPKAKVRHIPCPKQKSDLPQITA